MSDDPPGALQLMPCCSSRACLRRSCFRGTIALGGGSDLHFRRCLPPATTSCSASPASSRSRIPCSSAFGAYGVAITLAQGLVGWGAVLGGTAAAAASPPTAAPAWPLDLRLRAAIFFSMITLAVASFAQIVCRPMRDLTGGEDGSTYSLPALLPVSVCCTRPSWACLSMAACSPTTSSSRFRSRCSC